MSYIGVGPKLAAAIQQVDEHPELADYIIETLSASEDRDSRKIAEVLTLRRSKAAQVAALTPSPETIAETEWVRSLLEGVKESEAQKEQKAVAAAERAFLTRNDPVYKDVKFPTEEVYGKDVITSKGKTFLVDRPGETTLRQRGTKGIHPKYLEPGSRLAAMTPSFELKPWIAPFVAATPSDVLPSGRPMPEMFAEEPPTLRGAALVDLQDRVRGVTGSKALRIGKREASSVPVSGVSEAEQLAESLRQQAERQKLFLYQKGLIKYKGNADKARAFVARELAKIPETAAFASTAAELGGKVVSSAKAGVNPTFTARAQTPAQIAGAVRAAKEKNLAGATLGVGSAQAAKIAGEEVVEKAAAGAAPVVGKAATGVVDAAAAQTPKVAGAAAAGAAPVVEQAATAAADAATQAPKVANAGFWSGLAKMPLVGGALKALPYLGLALTAKEFLIDPVLEERKRNRTANAEALLRMRDNAEGVQYEQEQLALTQTLQKLMAQSRADEMRQVGQQVKLDFLVSPEEQKLIAQAGVPYMPSPWEYYGGGVSR